MATREENLKKINDELEKLDDEQLEKIAGGVERIDLLNVNTDQNSLIQAKKPPTYQPGVIIG